jgi:hypothetical protein
MVCPRANDVRRVSVERRKTMKARTTGLKVKAGKTYEPKQKVSNRPKHPRKAHWNPKAMIHQGIPAE